MLRRQPRATRIYTHFPYTPLFRSGADAGAVLAHLRMHRTGVHRSCRCGDIIRLPGQVPGRIRHEAFQTTCRTEMMGYPLMLGVIRGPDRIDLHATYRIRSEEQTSELQSLMRISYAVFCLKKK